jgi:RimJ/RimL family protein N-acetyltransferase
MKESITSLHLPVLEDQLIKLAPLRESDFERLYEVASDPLIWEQHPARDRYKIESFRLYFEGALSSKGAYIALGKNTGEVMGCSRYYDYDPANSTIAIGYTFLARKYWGGGYNRSMKKLMLDHAFTHADGNIRSQKAITKLGAVKIREMGFDMNGIELPHFEYEITKKDWISRAAL